MARPLRLELAGGIHHITGRGDRKAPLFQDDRDRHVFLEIFDDALRRFRWDCLTYCLMGNHYHLLVLTHECNLSDGMRHLNSTYARRFNDRRDACGHVFQGRFKAALVQREAHVLATLRYIALNPVVAGLCHRPEDWRWSGHAELLGFPRAGRVATTRAYEHFPGPARGPAQYRELVCGDGEIALEVGDGVIRGDAEFVAEHSPESRPSPEIARYEWQPQRPPLDALLADRHDTAAIALAYEHGYRQIEIARHLGCSYSTVSRRLRDWRMTECKT